MAAKRGAANYLTDQNWEDEEEAEEAGVFKQADENTMKRRTIVRAKRRTDASEEGSSTGLFKSFTGLTSKSDTTAVPTFSFGSGSTKPLGGLSNGTSGMKPAPFSLSPTKTKETTSFFGGSSLSTGAKSAFGGSMSTAANSDKDTNSHKSLTNGTGKSKGKYLQQLKNLNESVSKWIKEHVDKNPYCILTPIFKDYEKYLGEIEKDNPDKKPGSTAIPPFGQSDVLQTNKAESKILPDTDVTKPAPLEVEKKESSDFSFKPTSGPFTSLSATGLGSSSGSNSLSTGFPSFTGFGKSPSAPMLAGGNFEGTKPFSFAVGKPADSGASGSTQGTAEEEEYVPPKTEVEEVKEDDAFYSKRCKLFYQKEGAWVEKGVGNLHLKKCGDDKTQLVVRADTNLGNILLNIMLSKSIPTKRQGKNNVSMICIPNPPIDPKVDSTVPVSMLVRVKTSEDADDLLSKMDENKH